MMAERQLGARAESALKVFLDLMTGLREAAAESNVHQALETIVERTGYRAMLKSDPNPDAETRLANIEELLNAAAEGAERGESIADFLDHAALVADSDALDEGARISLLTIHNAKGLEFPIVFAAGMEEGLFPHQRSLIDENAMEEERRLCYVAMTRAEQKLTLSWARFRRRFGGGPAEPTLPSRFLKEVPGTLIERKGARSSYLDDGGDDEGVDLLPERFEVRESAKRNTFTGKTYNSVDNVMSFFKDRNLTPPAPRPEPKPFAVPPAPAKPQTLFDSKPLAQERKPGSLSFGAPPAARPSAKRPGTEFVGLTVNHGKYGRGTILRQEGEGDDAKLTISFPGYGLKKLIAKLAGINR